MKDIQFETKWMWSVITIGEGYMNGANLLHKALNESWTITKTTPTGNIVVYILKKLKD